MQGKILRDTANGDGIVFVNGSQKTFSLENHWKSGKPPTIGAIVEVTLNEKDEIQSVVLIESTEIAKQKAEEIANLINNNGKYLFSNVVATMGIPAIICIIGLLLSSAIFNFISIPVFLKSSGLTLFQLLKGFNQLIFLAFIFSPFSVAFLKTKRSYLSYFAPFCFFMIMILIGLKYVLFPPKYSDILMSSNPELGLGFYLFFIISLCLCFLGFKKIK